MEIPAQEHAGVTWDAMQTARRLSRQAKLAQDALSPPPSLPVQSPIAHLGLLISQTLQVLEKDAAGQLFAATDSEDLDERIDDLLRDERFQRHRADMLSLLSQLRPSPPGDGPGEAGPPPELLEGAGPEGADWMTAIDLVMAATTQARAELITAIEVRLVEHPEQRKDISGVQLRFHENPLWFLHETALPSALKQALYAAQVSEVCTLAVGAARYSATPTWLRKALLERWYTSARLFLRLLAGLPGVSLPRPLNQKDPLELAEILRQHAEAEQGYSLRLGQARTSGQGVFPPPKDGDDL